ncbi:MAG TPA: agmatine deiminase family protein [Planctomycetota bacterium]|nr:agmatine deiminase family protein [Planctomycetota bacterium]
MIPPPGRSGYAIPAEWAPHRATWIAWPHNRADWPGKFEPIPWAYGEIVRVLSRNERVCILVQNPAARHAAKSLLKKVGVDLKKVDFFPIPTDRVWTRDSGAIFVTDGTGNRIATHWKFNGWAKYPNHKRDDLVAARIAKALKVPEYPVTAEGRDVVMEGGAIDVDGQGTLMATEECLLSKVQARNPKLGRDGIERVFADVLGIRRVVWLDRGIVGDDTHGHIDDLARFVAPGRVVLCQELNEKDENHEILRINLERLQAEKLEVIPLPMPSPIVFDRQRVPASYANFLIANGVVIVPTFNDPKDRIALGILADCFPDREIVGIHCVDFVWGLGTLHCATQQEPM